MKVIVLLLFCSFACVCQGKNATRVLLTEAAKQGAVCLDGSPPGYYIRPGYGNGTNKWILHLGGGGWCVNEGDCYNRSKTYLGSSKNWPSSAALNGFLSDNSSVNPEFFNWNIVYLMYCDGASFAGYGAKPIHYNNTPIYFRGRPVLQADLDNLLEIKGMRNASEIILTGCSAGGLATYMRADYVRAYLPQSIKFHAMADAGYFLDIKTVKGEWAFRDVIQYVFKMQNASGGVNQDCLKAYSEDEAWKCFFAPYSYQYIKSPMFVLNSDYDTAQLAGILKLGCLPPNCTEEQMKFFNNFRTEFLEQAKPAIASHTNGIFLDSCLIHCQTLYDKPWSTFEIEGKQPMREVFSDWYHGRTRGGVTRQVDCAYPCNPTCKGVFHEEEQVLISQMFN